MILLFLFFFSYKLKIEVLFDDFIIEKNNEKSYLYYEW